MLFLFIVATCRFIIIPIWKYNKYVFNYPLFTHCKSHGCVISWFCFFWASKFTRRHETFEQKLHQNSKDKEDKGTGEQILLHLSLALCLSAVVSSECFRLSYLLGFLAAVYAWGCLSDRFSILVASVTWCNLIKTAIQETREQLSAERKKNTGFTIPHKCPLVTVDDIHHKTFTHWKLPVYVFEAELRNQGGQWSCEFLSAPFVPLDGNYPSVVQICAFKTGH